MRNRPLSARKQAKATMQLRDEAANMLGMSPQGVERLTRELAPTAREGGGTEGDALVLLHRMAHHQQQRPYDFDYILAGTLGAVDDLTLVGVHGMPLKALIHSAEPLVQVCIGICELLWQEPFTEHRARAERRNLQIDHARVSATAVLSSQADELEEIREKMSQLGVEPDPELEAQVRRERDAEGIEAPPWEK